MTLEFEIPGVPLGPNQFRNLGALREKMRVIRTERERAQLAARVARNANGVAPISGPAAITFTVYRRFLLDPMVNLPGSLKHYQDGVWKELLPLGDGPGTPYTWNAPTQVKVRTTAEERVVVRIETP